MFVTQKCVTPSHGRSGASQVVGLVVSMQPPWSTLMSTMTLPGFHRPDHLGRHDVRRACAGDEHRADDDVRGAHRVGDIGDVRIQRR